MQRVRKLQNMFTFHFVDTLRHDVWR